MKRNLPPPHANPYDTLIYNKKISKIFEGLLDAIEFLQNRFYI